MQVQIEDISPVEKKLAVEIPWENVRQKLDTAYRELGKGVELRGFRKGKVPRSVLERMFGRQVQMEVAKALRRPQSFVSKCESGERRVDVVELEEFAKLYRRSLSFFLPKGGI